MTSRSVSFAAGPADGVCPTCNQPVITSNDERNNNAAAPPPKRKSDAPSHVTSSSRRKLRHSETESTGHFPSVWEENQLVWVNVHDGYGGRGWEPGVIRNIEEDVDGVKKIVAHAYDERGDAYVPRVFKDTNQDAIPIKKPSDAKYKLSNYIMQRKETDEALFGMGNKLFRCLKYFHRQGRGDPKEQTDKLDFIGKALLDKNADPYMSLRNIVFSLMANDQVNKVVSIATNSQTKCSPQFALAYLVGQFCGIEVSESVTDDVDPHRLLDRIGGEDSVDCPISQVFLISAMTARTDKRKGVNPRANLYDPRARAVLTDEDKLKRRLGILQTALAAIHASQSAKPSVSGPSFALLSHGIRMMIDMRGTSDPLLDRLAAEGVCRPARVLRYWIQKLSAAIDPLDVRSSPPIGKSHVVGWTADNADQHTFHNNMSCVPVGNVLLGNEPVECTTHLNENFMKGLPGVSDIQVEDLAANQAEDEIAKCVINNQNVCAILTAAVGMDWINELPVSARSNATLRPSIDDNVTFNFRSQERKGKVKNVIGKKVDVEFKDGGSHTIEPIELRDIVSIDSGNETDDNNHEETDNDNQEEQSNEPEIKTSAKNSPEMFDGDRHRFDPTTTSITSILTGLSSKNSETAKQVIDEVIAQCGEEKFFEAVHVLVADQEFMEQMQIEFFSHLASDKKMPMIPCLAIGHAMKSLCVSMITYYQCFFDPMLEALGVKIGSPEHKRFCKGTVIRKTNALVTDFTEMLALAAARQYLSKVGNDSRIKGAAGGLTSPMAIIKDYFTSAPTRRHPVTVIDSNTRPLSIEVTEPLKFIAKDFELWIRELYGAANRVEVGPSGYQRHSEEVEPQEADPEYHRITQIIENDPGGFLPFRNLPYADEGDTQGALTQCTNLGLLVTNSRKDKLTLQQKLYICNVLRDKEAAIKFGPSRKLPKGINSTGIVLCDLLFGPERFALIMGHLLTRVRPRDPTNDKKRYPTDWLVFFKAITASTFMRWQPHYQRLTLTFLIQLTLILKHKDNQCIDLSLKRIRWTFSLSEKGDSYRCTPLDLHQEGAIIEEVKKVGRRDPWSFRNLRSRVLLSSFFRLKRIEARAAMDSPFPNIQPENVSKVQEEQRQSRAIVAVWTDILQALDASDPAITDSERIVGLGNDESQVLFADRSRAYWRPVDATDHIMTAGVAFLKGYELGYAVAITPRPFLVLRRLYRVRKKKSASPKSQLSTSAQQRKLDAEQSLSEDKCMTVQSSHSMLDGIDKAGEGKANVYTAVLSTLSKNEPYSQNKGQYYMGDDPGKPIVLAINKSAAAKYVFQRATKPNGDVAPIHRYVDTAKDMRCHIPRRSGGEFPNTLNELARDLICFTINKYYAVGVELICLTMDVPQLMTSLRVIPHAKRGKMDGITIPHGTLAKVTKGTDDLSPYMDRSDLLICGDENFTKLLFNTICNQAKAIEEGTWSPPWRSRRFVLVVIGGSPQACVAAAVGKDSVRLNSKSIEASCKEIETEMKKSKIVNAEEGEMMVFGAVRTTTRIGLTHDQYGEGIDSISEIFSDDSDAFAGISMQAIYGLESTCILKDKTFSGAILLHGARKSVAQISKLGKVFKTNLDIDRDLCPAGVGGFECILDLVSIYYSLENDNSLPVLPPGHRAISAVAVAYTLTNNDYMRMAGHGFTPRMLIATMKSRTYKAEVGRPGLAAEDISPINFTRTAVFMDETYGADTGYNLLGIQLLLHHAFINRSLTRAVLLSKYSLEDLSQGFAYNIVRAAAILAGEARPVPDPPAILAYVSCAHLIFRRWSCILYDKNKKTDDELSRTCYAKSIVKGRTVVSVDFTLRNIRSSLSDSLLLSTLRTNYYGGLFSDSQLKLSNIMPFDPMEEVKASLQHQGFYPSIKVSAELLPEPKKLPAEGVGESSTEEANEDLANDINEMLEESGDYEMADDESAAENDDTEDERSVAGSLSDGDSVMEIESEDENGAILNN